MRSFARGVSAKSIRYCIPLHPPAMIRRRSPPSGFSKDLRRARIRSTAAGCRARGGGATVSWDCIEANEAQGGDKGSVAVPGEASEDNRHATLKYGPRVFAPFPRYRSPHARATEGLRDGHVGGLLHGPIETPGGVPGDGPEDPRGEVSVLLRPRAHDPAGDPRVPEGGPDERPRVVDPVRP